jgi:hypothetical protein
MQATVDSSAAPQPRKPQWSTRASVSDESVRLCVRVLCM